MIGRLRPADAEDDIIRRAVAAAAAQYLVVAPATAAVGPMEDAQSSAR